MYIIKKHFSRLHFKTSPSSFFYTELNGFKYFKQEYFF